MSCVALFLVPPFSPLFSALEVRDRCFEHSVENLSMKLKGGLIGGLTWINCNGALIV